MATTKALELSQFSSGLIVDEATDVATLGVQVGVDQLKIGNTTVIDSSRNATFTGFTSTGIDDNAAATALTIDSNGSIAVSKDLTSKDLRVGTADAGSAIFGTVDGGYPYVAINSRGSTTDIFDRGRVYAWYIDALASVTTPGSTLDNVSNTFSLPVVASDTLSVTGNTTLSGTLGVTSNTTLSGTLGVTGNVTLAAELRGPATFVIDPAAVGDNTGTVVIKGNLQVDGTTTTINSTTLSIDDKNIVLADGAADSLAADGAGITVAGANANLNYVHSGTKWQANKAFDITANTASTSTTTGALTVAGGVGVSGQVTATSISATNLTGTVQTVAQPNITSTGSLTVPGFKINVPNSYTAANPANSGTTPVGVIGTITGTSYNQEINFGLNQDTTFWLQNTNKTAYNVNYPISLNPNGGNVGIGTITPTRKLDVRGDVLLKGDATDGGVLSITRRYSTGPQTINFNNNHPSSNLDWTGARITSADAGQYNGYLDFAVSKGSNANEAAGSAAVGSVMRLTKDGLVGVGTTLPTNTLHVLGQQANTSNSNVSTPSGTLRLDCAVDGTESGGVHGASLVFSQRWWNGTSGTVATGQITGIKVAGNGSFGGGLAFWTSDNDANFMTERLRINQLGNVGVGTATPGTSRLSVALTSYPSTGGEIANFIGGTTSPTTERFVQLSQSYTGGAFDSPMLVFRSNANASNQSAFGTIRGTADGFLVFGTASATNSGVSAAASRMWISSTGNVGIGNAAGSEGKLYVGTTTVTDRNGIVMSRGIAGTLSSTEVGIFNEWNGINGNIECLTLRSPGGYKFQNNIGNSEWVRITGTGNVGIGTTAPTQRLSVSTPAAGTGALTIDDGSGFLDRGVITTHVARQTQLALVRAGVGTLGFDITTDGTAIMTGHDTGTNILAMKLTTGNVGIGTTNPQTRLDVNGTIRNAAGVKTYSVLTPGNGAQGFIYEIGRVSRDVNNWSEQLGYDITVYNRYYFGGVARWYVTYNQVDGGTVIMRDSGGTHRNRLYLGSEVTVAGAIRYRPILVEIPAYQQCAIEVKYSNFEVSSISGASQIQFTGTMTNASVNNFSPLYTVESQAGIRSGRTIYNWFEWGGSPGAQYFHIKTTLWGGGSPNGNSQPTMSMFHVKGYNYDAHTIDGMIGFHNWAGTPHQMRVSNAGSWPGAHGAYVSSDGYIVLVFNTTANYPGISIDYYQSYPYTWQDVRIITYSSSNSTSGVY